MGARMVAVSVARWPGGAVESDVRAERIVGRAVELRLDAEKRGSRSECGDDAVHAEAGRRRLFGHI